MTSNHDINDIVSDINIVHNKKNNIWGHTATVVHNCH